MTMQILETIVLATVTMAQYPTQSHYSATEVTSPCPLLVIPISAGHCHYDLISSSVTLFSHWDNQSLPSIMNPNYQTKKRQVSSRGWWNWVTWHIMQNWTNSCHSSVSMLTILLPRLPHVFTLSTYMPEGVNTDYYTWRHVIVMSFNWFTSISCFTHEIPHTGNEFTYIISYLFHCLFFHSTPTPVCGSVQDTIHAMSQEMLNICAGI